jgi:hypothetical protein
MATITSVVGTRTALTTSALNSLASNNYVSCGTINHTTNNPLDVLLEVTVDADTSTGNQRCVVFAKGSLDGTNFETGPESGSTTTNEPDLTFVGVVPCRDTNSHTKIFSLASAFGGVLPQHTRIIVKNETGGALASSGHSVYYSEVTGASA